jgi:hypothetical protein
MKRRQEKRDHFKAILVASSGFTHFEKARIYSSPSPIHGVKPYL